MTLTATDTLVVIDDSLSVLVVRNCIFGTVVVTGTRCTSATEVRNLVVNLYTR